MSGRVGAVVRCAGRIDGLFATLRSLWLQSPPAEFTVVVGPATPAAARPWIEAVAARRGGTVVAVRDDRPGPARNAGVERLESEYVVCLDAGERADRRYFRLVAERFDADPRLALLVPAVADSAPDGAVGFASPAGVSTSDLASELDLVHGASAFRRADWLRVGGFDSDLEQLGAVDLWFRLLALGRGELIERPMVARSPARFDPEVEESRAESYLAELERLIERHSEAFRADVPTLVERAERRRQRARAEHGERVARRDRGLAELAELDRRIAELAASSPPPPPAVDAFPRLGRTSPLSREWGFERGGPVDRLLIERFLERNAADIRGVVLEIQEDRYTRRFGGDRVTRGEILDLDVGNPMASVVADLRDAANLASGSFDCVLLTQTVHVVDDARAVLAEAFRLLAPGGTLLVTLPCASRVCLEYGPDGDFWRVTPAGARALFAGIVPPEQLEVGFEGSVATTAAFLYGLGAPELDTAARAAADPFHPTIVTVRARKPRPADPVPEPRANLGAAPFASSARRGVDPPRAVVLLYHRVGWPPSDLHGFAVAPEEFRAQLARLAERCRVLPLAELAEAAARNRLPPGAVALTFDDGYADNLEIAAPLLEQYGLPATFFVTTADWEERRAYWWDLLAQALLFAPSPPRRLVVDLEERRLELATADLAARRRAHDALHGELRRASAAGRQRALAQVLAWAGDPAAPPPADARLAASEIERLASRPGVSIGAHTVHHLLLEAQSEPVQRDEIAASLAAISARIGRPVDTLAYPYGGCSETTVRVARELGVVWAATTEAAPLSASSDPLRLPRYAIGGRGARARFEAAMSSLATGA